MSMFCFQCQETARNQGCTVRGVCGKGESTAKLQDLLINACKGIAFYACRLKGKVEIDKKFGRAVCQYLFTTVTNVGWDDKAIIERIKEARNLREEIKNIFLTQTQGPEGRGTLPEELDWNEGTDDGIIAASEQENMRITYDQNEDVRSLRQLLIIGCKGIAAYAEHAAVLGHEDQEIYDFLMEALDSTIKELSTEQMVGLVMRAGEMAVKTMALLDKANTARYGDPEITEVQLGVGKRPGILVSGHDLKDLEELLEQSADAGVDVYTHGEMLPAHYYPIIKKHGHLHGNYGGSWWSQNEEFESFNGPIVMTTNCLVPLKNDNTYLDRLFTTGVVSYPGAEHIAPEDNGIKDFSKVIALAQTCAPPEELESGTLTGGFAHAQVLALAEKIVEAVESGAIKRFIVMAGCDGRHKSRDYFTEVAGSLPEDTVILTAGCAKYRYNKMDLGDIGGIPRVLDAGQCNDSYSLAVVALKLKEVFGLDDINELPISFDIAWYEQKAVAVLLALLSLGVKGLRLGPTLPAFLSPNVADVLVKNFDIKPVGDVLADIDAMMAGR